MASKPLPTADRVRELLHYDEASGLFTWRVQTNGRVKAGKTAGSLCSGGYFGIGIDRRLFLSHRVAWLWMTGAWPALQIDHIDGDITNNRWSNLREVDGFANQQNQRRARVDNTTGLLGVSRNRNGFQASIQANGKHCYLGFFKTAEAAHQAYMAAKASMHPGAHIVGGAK